MMAVRLTYAEVKLADLPVREGKEAREWLTSMHREVECARGHISMRIRDAGERGKLLYPFVRRYSHHQQRKRRAKTARFCRGKNTDTRSCRQVRDAVDRVRLRASRNPGTTTKPLDGGPGEVGHKRLRDMNEAAVAQRVSLRGLTGTAQRQVRRHAAIIAWLRSTMAPAPRARLMQGERPQGASETDLADSTSESDTSDPGGMLQPFRGPPAPGACPPKTPRMLLRRQMATRGFATRPVVVARPRKKTRGPTLLRKPGCKVRTRGTSDTSIVLRIARRAREDDDGKIRSEMAVQGAEEPSTTDDDEGSSGFRPAQRAGADSSPVEVGVSNAEAPTPEQPPGEGDEFARELASTMSAIANLVVKA
jgi:hypothetical protein